MAAVLLPPPLHTDVAYVSFGMLFPIHRRSCAERAHTRRDDLFGTMGANAYRIQLHARQRAIYTYIQFPFV